VLARPTRSAGPLDQFAAHEGAMLVGQRIFGIRSTMKT
jgi:hypothetical protein